jgi:hypothetical protein
MTRDANPQDSPPAPSDPSPPSSPCPLLGYASGVHFPVENPNDGAAFRDGTLLIALNGTTLPQRCVLCGGISHSAPVRLAFTWDSSFRVSSTSTLELRKTAFMFAYLCQQHRAVWSRARRYGGIGAIFGLVVMCAGMTLSVLSESSVVPSYTAIGISLTIAGFAVVIASLFFLSLRSRTLTCQRIQEGYLYLDGAGEEFIKSLPPLPGKSSP